MLETEICHIKMRNPTMLAAGILGSTAASLNWAESCGAGAVVTKSFGIEPNPGYPNPTTVEVTGGFINAIGLSNPGVNIFKEELKRFKGNVPLIASIYGSDVHEFQTISQKVENLVDMLELNVSCPHAMEGCGAAIGQDPKLTAKIVKSVKEVVKCPIIVKLTPNVTDIVEIASSATKAGADALTLINSLGPGMCIDLETGKPVLSNKFGGMSGPAIKPIALRCVYQVYSELDLPLIGVGGISNYKDVVEFLYAGAVCVQIGTAIYYGGLEIFTEINKDLERFMLKKGYQSTQEMVGRAHKS